MHRTLQASFSVPTTYPVHFTRQVFAPENSILKEVCSTAGPSARVFTVVDSGAARAFPDLPSRIQCWARRHDVRLVTAPVILEGGEAVKNNYRSLMTVMDQLLEHHLCRHSVLLALGGGAMLDAVGLAASLLHRGIRIIRLPSTTLAQNDAGIGVKTGMNLHGLKNAIGTFAPPLAVINDLDLLNGLPDARWRDGISEAFKVALIKDADFYRELLTLAPALGRREQTAMESLIVRCAALHLDHISNSGDPFEQGSARPLDFGHWSAHKLESMSNYRISHGEAVAIGISLDTLIAEQLSFVPAGTADPLIHALRQCGFDLHPPELEERLGDGSLRLIQGLEEFREHLGGTLTLSFPSPVGSMTELHGLEPERIEGAVQRIRACACA